MTIILLLTLNDLPCRRGCPSQNSGNIQINNPNKRKEINHMKVETYEIEEINSSDAATMAADSESIALSQKMGLEGQLKLVNKETDTRCPYRKISALEHLVYTTLFPVETNIRHYSSGIIPLRVLQVIAHAKDSGLFPRLEIWHTLDHREKDPVLVGYDKESQWDSDRNCFILARWGEALPSLDELAEKAKTKWLALRKAKIADVIREVNQLQSGLQTEADAAFAGGEVKIHNFYI